VHTVLESGHRLVLTISHCRYYADHQNIKSWPPEVQDYNERFTGCIETIKKRHDAVVTTVGESFSLIYL
jgi:hypothetical protein